MKLKLKLVMKTSGFDWVAIGPESTEVLRLSISKEKNMFVVAERFLSKVVKEYGGLPLPPKMELPGIHKSANF